MNVFTHLTPFTQSVFVILLAVGIAGVAFVLFYNRKPRRERDEHETGFIG